MFITTANGGIKEIVQDIEYFHINSSEDLFKSFLIASNLSDADKKRIKQKGKERALNFDWKIISEKLYNIYLEVKNEKYHRNRIMGCG